MAERRAVIDVGTNSVKLLVADVDGRKVTPVWESSEQTRLGEGFFGTQILQPEPLQRTARAVARFAAEAKRRNVDGLRVVATSAARDASNPAELLHAIRDLAGLEVEIISGEQEADWAFAGVMTDPSMSQRPALILDVGGGSTEFIMGDGTSARFRQSFQLGTVRLLEHFSPSDPPTPDEWNSCEAHLRKFFSEQIKPALVPALRSDGISVPMFVGTGGTTTILARMELGTNGFDRERIEAVRISHKSVQAHRERVWGMAIEQRRGIIGLPANRADVILMGTAVYSILMSELELNELRVSTRGLRFAAVADWPNVGKRNLPA